MLEPKNTLVGLAGQKAWHIWTGEALPRISGKYFPSQLRTQKAGPELATTGRDGAAGCGVLPKGSAKKFACGGAFCCYCMPPNRKSNRPSAEASPGASTIGTTIATATSINRRRLR